MAVQALRQLEKEQVPVSDNELTRLVERNAGMSEARSKINTLLDRFDQNRFATKESIQQYREAADADQSEEGLKGFYQWMGEQWFKANVKLRELQSEIDQGIRDKIMSDGDREFLMQKLILTDEHDFIGPENLPKIEKLLKQKMDRMKKDREKYDQIKNHALVQNTGFLKPDANTKIEIPELNKFLGLTVPERRELLEKAEKALPKAKEYAKITEAAEDIESLKQYDQLIHKAQHTDKIIGQKTADKFRNGFKKIDSKEKAVWVKEFSVQMSRYQTLWGSIRKTLKGDALKQMEASRDKLGYTDLFQEFGRLKQKESVRMNTDYQKLLSEARQQRLISAHTERDFMADMKTQPFEGKQGYLEKFSAQMARYKALRESIDQLENKEAKAVIDEMYESESFGYSEIKAKFDRLSSVSGGVGEVSSSDKVVSISSRVRRERVRKNMHWFAEGASTGQMERMVNVLNHTMKQENSQSYNASDYVSSIKAKRKKQQKKLEEKVQKEPVEVPRVANENLNVPAPAGDNVEKQEEASINQPISIASQEQQAKKMENEQGNYGVRVKSAADDAFQETVISDGEKETTEIRAGIGDKKAMTALLDSSRVLDEKKRISLMAKDGEIDRMNYEEVIHFRDFLQATLNLKKATNDNQASAQEVA